MNAPGSSTGREPTKLDDGLAPNTGDLGSLRLDLHLQPDLDHLG